MEIAELRDLFAELARKRPLFHSEADFQHAFAWEIQLRYPAAKVRLQQQIQEGIQLDARFEIEGHRTGLELRYMVRRLSMLLDGERFELHSQAGRDIRRYDVVRDLRRLQQLVASGVLDTGFAVVLTNDSRYWLASRRPATLSDWTDYSAVAEGPGGRFRYLAVPVRPKPATR
jgi:hypothetical protein